MANQDEASLKAEFRAALEALPTAPWIEEMWAHYTRTGTYRWQDLRRFLGDPAQGVNAGDLEEFGRQLPENILSRSNRAATVDS